MNSGSAFRQFAKQLETVARQGGGGGNLTPGRGGAAGAGLLVALVGGGLLLNASLFNGALIHDYWI